MNNKRIYFFFIIFILHFNSVFIFSQDKKDWISHISYAADINTIVQVEDMVYALTDGKLFIYNIIDDSLEEYIKEKGNTDIIHIVYNKTHKCLFITRDDGNIELLYDDKSYRVIPDLKEYSAQNLDKTINHVFMDENFAYLSMNFGFLVINLDGAEVKESGKFNIKFHSLCLLDNHLYAATEQGVFFVDRNQNEKDFSNWKNFPVSDFYDGDQKYNFTDSQIEDILVFQDKLHFLVPDVAVYIMESPSTVKTVLTENGRLSMFKTKNDHLIITSAAACWDYESLTQYSKINIDSLKYIVPKDDKANEYWVSSAGNNLSLVKVVDSQPDFIQTGKAPRGPASNYPFSQTVANGQLIVTGGGFHYNRFNYPASISVLKDKSAWSNILQHDIYQESGLWAQDFIYALSDPSNSNRIFVSSWGEGLYEFEDNRFKNRYDQTNSTIEPIVMDNFSTTRVGGMTFDRSGNLWLLNSMVENIVKVYLKTGEWTQLYYSAIDKAGTNPKNILIDRYSNKWITTIGQDKVGDAYLFIFDDKGTISDTSDDRYKYQNKFYDRNGNSLFITDTNSITEDNDGNIWLGTDIGPFLIYNSPDIVTRADDIRFDKIMIERGTGSGSVIGLLEDAVINDIVVDGANQKWIATQSAGLFLLSSDNKEVLEKFTVDTSPLPSNNIISLSVDSRAGTVYIGTDRGLMAYKTGITKGADSFSNVYAYPNPVRPEYDGVITITGLKSDTRVKITDIKGNLIAGGKSQGGQFFWNGLNSRGKRVDTGVYLVFGSYDNGAESVVTKIMVVRD